MTTKSTKTKSTITQRTTEDIKCGITMKKRNGNIHSQESLSEKTNTILSENVILLPTKKECLKKINIDLHLYVHSYDEVCIEWMKEIKEQKNFLEKNYVLCQRNWNKCTVFLKKNFFKF